MMTPAEFLGHLDRAIARTRRRNGVALTLSHPEVLGHTGREIGGAVSSAGGPVYGYTKRQCEEMRAVILAAAADDARGQADG